MILCNDFISEFRSIKDDIDNAISGVLDRGWFILGKELEQFENEFERFLDAEYCVGVASGTDALTLSLLACGVGNGDEVITTDLTAFPTIIGIVNSRATPVLVDVHLMDGLISPDRIEEKITSKTKAIVPVHLYGQCCDMKSIKSLAKSHNLKIIEDCAHACGAEFDGKKVGTIGDCGAFSFYPTKNLGAYGDGGAIVTNQVELYERLRSLRNYGQPLRNHQQLIGYNSRLDEIQAAILRIKLRHLDNWNQIRREMARYYDKNLMTVKPLVNNDYGKHVYHLYVVRSQNRKILMEYLRQNDIQTLIHYPVSINKQYFTNNVEDSGSFFNSEKLVDELVSLPINPWLSQNELDQIVGCINDFRQ